MKKKILSILFTISYISAFAQSHSIQWEKSLGGSSTDEAYSIEPTSDGGYIVAGQSLSVDGQVTGHHGTSSSIDYWVVKLDDTGGIQWENSFGGTDDDLAYSVRQTLDGGYIVAGAAASTDGDLSTCTITSDYRYWLLKLSSTGSVDWENCFGGGTMSMYANKAFFVRQTLDSGYIVAGYTDAGDGGEVAGYNGGTGDYWIVKLSSSGGLVWTKCLGGSGFDLANCVQPTSDSGYIVIGKSNSTDGQVTGNHGNDDYWVVKLNDTGGIQWEKSYGGAQEDDGNYIIPTFDGGYIVAGESYSTNGQVTGHHGDTTTADYWIVKLNDTGGITWETSLGGAGNEIAYAIQQTADSGYIVTGSSDSTSDDVTGNHGNDDYWVVKLTKTGTIQWQKSFGGSGTDDAYSIEQTPDGGCIMAGGSNSTDGDVTGNHGAYDYWVVKLAPCSLASPVIRNSHDTLGTTLSYASYQWSVNGVPVPGATNATFVPGSHGGYTVSVIDTNGCTATLAQVSGISNLAYAPAINIMPNPTTGEISITGDVFASVHVYSITGQLVKESAYANKISISEMPCGLYFLKFYNEQGELVCQKKIIKQ